MASNPGLIRNASGGHPDDMVSSSSSAWARFSLSCCYRTLAMADGDEKCENNGEIPTVKR